MGRRRTVQLVHICNDSPSFFKKKYLNSVASASIEHSRHSSTLSKCHARCTPRVGRHTPCATWVATFAPDSQQRILQSRSTFSKKKNQRMQNVSMPPVGTFPKVAIVLASPSTDAIHYFIMLILKRTIQTYPTLRDAAATVFACPLWEAVNGAYDDVTALATTLPGC